MAQSKAGRSIREANGPARSEPVQVRVQPVPMFRPRDRWWLAAVVVAAVLPYLDSLQGAFVFDDFGLVTQNPYAAPGMPLLAWFTRPSTSGSLYRPLTMVSYGLNALLSPNPLSYHLMNVALHALAALAAFSLARSLLRSTPAAGVAALLFAVHPVHTEPVANIAGRAEVLAGLFSLLALACFARATDAAAGKRLWFVASLAAFAAGLLSKESAFATIALVALVSMWIERAHLLTVVRRVLPYVALGVAFVALRWFAVGAITLAEPPPFIDNPLAHVGLLARLATALVVLGDYGSVLAVPLRLSADDSFNQVPVVHSLADPRLVGTTAVILALALALGAARRRMPVLPFAALFFVFAIALTSNVCFPIGTIKAERMLYLPSFSWCLACGWLLRRWTGRVLGERALVVALVLLGLAARTWVRNADWRDSYTLFTKTVATSPGSARAHANVAAVHGAAGDLDFASDHFRAALEIYPEFGPALVGLAQVSALRGARQDAIHWYSEAIRLEPANLEPYVRLGELLLQAGDARRAEEVYHAGLARVPNHPLLLLGVASSLARQGDRSRANDFLARAEANPALPPDIARRAQVLRRELQGP